MTEFRAPPPPPELDWNPDTDESIEENVIGPHPNPKMIGVAVGLVLIGVCVGALMFSSSPESLPPQGLTNIVDNPEIMEPLPVCGQQRSQTSPCILYVINHTRFDKKAEDFFETARMLMDRNKSHIEIENTSYAKKSIPPGFFAEIKIPALR
ncbi:MAG: hypothetical protein J6Y85_02170 [Alphaproteobacteria bacterium]|nr:hypothetical protein [Alphaproteobacteria bacterium]